jgi:hypothetical protein
VTGVAQSIVAAPSPAQLQKLVGYYVTDQGGGLELSVTGGKLFVQSAGAPPTPVDVTTEGSMMVANRLYRVAYGPDGAVRDIRYAMVGEHPAIYVPARRVEPSQAELQAIAGSYHSDELDITYRLAVCGKDLTASIWRQPTPVKLVPSVKDSFDSTAGGWTVERDTTGKPTGLRLDAGRVLGVKFKRTPDAGPLPVGCS